MMTRRGKPLGSATGLVALILSLLVTAPCVLVRGEEPAPTTTNVDTIFRGDTPRSLDELRAMEKRQQEIVTKVTPSTVGLQIGQAQGSGVIVSGDGYVLTAAHVAQRPGLPVQIILHNGRVVRGKTLGLDRSSDAGMIKIESAAPDDQPWPHLEMGESAGLSAGQWCLVTGHPGGYEPGRLPVVRFGRLLSVNSELLVTDCALVGGDSGGPLLDMDGKVIGIHSRIGGSLTANMHVPVAIYREHWDRMAAGEMWGDVPRGAPYIGVRGDPESENAKIVHVEPGQPADRAGLQVGDIVTRFDGMDVSNFAALAAMVADREPGEKVKLDVRRGEATVELEMEIGRRR